jgi:hypothetical protein
MLQPSRVESLTASKKKSFKGLPPFGGIELRGGKNSILGNGLITISSFDRFQRDKFFSM